MGKTNNKKKTSATRKTKKTTKIENNVDVFLTKGEILNSKTQNKEKDYHKNDNNKINNFEKTEGVGGETNNLSSDDEKTTNNVSSILATINKDIIFLEQTNFSKMVSYSEWTNFIEKYSEVSKKIEDLKIDNDILSKDSFDINVFRRRLDVCFHKYSLAFSKWQVDNSKNIEAKMEKQQGINFAILSIFMALVTFILTNVLSRKEDNYDFKTVLLSNIMLLFIVIILLSFAAIFLGFIKSNQRKREVLGKVALIIIPILVVVAAFVCVYIFM